MGRLRHRLTCFFMYMYIYVKCRASHRLLSGCLHIHVAMEFIGSWHAAIAETYNLVPGSKGLLDLKRSFSRASLLISGIDQCVAIGDEDGLFDFILASLNS